MWRQRKSSWDFSFQFSRLVVSDCLWPHGLQHFPVHHQLLELVQTHVHQVGDVIQPSHPLSSPSPPTFNFSQHQGLFKWVSSSHQVAKVLEFQLQHQCFQCTNQAWLCLASKIRWGRERSGWYGRRPEFLEVEIRGESNGIQALVCDVDSFGALSGLIRVEICLQSWTLVPPGREWREQLCTFMSFVVGV